MPLRKPEARPLIAQVSPAAAIAGGELQIRGKGFAQDERPRVTIAVDANHQTCTGSAQVP